MTSYTESEMTSVVRALNAREARIRELEAELAIERKVHEDCPCGYGAPHEREGPDERTEDC